MISLASGLRIYLACGVTDMRNYVATMIMRSPIGSAATPTVPYSGLGRSAMPFLSA